MNAHQTPIADLPLRHLGRARMYSVKAIIYYGSAENAVVTSLLHTEINILLII